jgi:hypothetical protein
MFIPGKLYVWQPQPRPDYRPEHLRKRYVFYFGGAEDIYGPDCFEIQSDEVLCMLQCIKNSTAGYKTWDVQILSPEGHIGWSRINEYMLDEWCLASE